MVRFANILIGYLVMGAIMFGAGVVTWDNAGLITLVVEGDGDQARANASTSEDLDRMGSTILGGGGSLLGAANIALVASWTFLTKAIGFMFWPLTAMITLNAPTAVVITAGGIPSGAFLVLLIQEIRGA